VTSIRIPGLPIIAAEPGTAITIPGTPFWLCARICEAGGSCSFLRRGGGVDLEVAN
jgi:hypothetical protein